MRPCLLLLLIALPAAAQIYKSTDAHGNTTYSDQPARGAPGQAIALPPLNSIEPRQPTPPQAPAVEHQQPHQNRATYAVLELSGLSDRQVLRANNGSFTVDILLQPDLRDPHRLQLLLDDKPYGQPGKAARQSLTNLDRGEHRLAVQVLEGAEVVQQSPAITFYLQRAHRP